MHTHISQSARATARIVVVASVAVAAPALAETPPRYAAIVLDASCTAHLDTVVAVRDAKTGTDAFIPSGAARIPVGKRLDVKKLEERLEASPPLRAEARRDAAGAFVLVTELESLREHTFTFYVPVIGAFAPLRAVRTLNYADFTSDLATEATAFVERARRICAERKSSATESTRTR